MRKLFAVAAVAFLAACGSSSSDSGPSRPSGATVTGTIGGHAFAAVDVEGIATSAVGCTLTNAGGVVISANAIELAITSYASGACADLLSQCHTQASSQKVTVVVAAVNVGASAAPALGPGTYNVVSSLTSATPSGSGVLTLAYAESLAVDAACAGTPHKSTATGGHVWIDSVSGSAITGAVSIAFDDGSSISGSFHAAVCPSTPSVCDAANTIAGGTMLCSGALSCGP